MSEAHPIKTTCASHMPNDTCQFYMWVVWNLFVGNFCPKINTSKSSNTSATYANKHVKQEPQIQKPNGGNNS